MTTFGIFHTAVSLVALVAGAVALLRHKEISLRNRIGQLYGITTFITAATGLFIFHHGGFGKPHALALLTLLAIGIALFAKSVAVKTVAWSATFFFSWIPAITETTTRLPVDAPIFASPDAPQLLVINGVLFALFLAGAAAQVARLRKTEESKLLLARW